MLSHPTHDYSKIGNNARRLRDFPLPSDLYEEMMMFSVQDRDLMGPYRDLLNQSVIVGDLEDKIDALEDPEEQERVRAELIEERQKIGELVREAPDIAHYQYKHAQALREQDIKDEVRGMAPEEILLTLKEYIPEERWLQTLEDIKKDPENAMDIATQLLIDSKLASQRTVYLTEIVFSKRIRNHMQKMMEMSPEDFENTFLQLAETLGFTDDEIEPYKKGDNREEFFNKYGPLIVSKYVASATGELNG